MLKRKWFPVIMVAFMIGAISMVFAAGKPEEAKEPEKVINFWYWDQNAEALYTELIGEYEAEHPDVKVNFSVLPWGDYWTKLQIALPTGTGPDIFWVNHPNAATYIPTGLVMNLEPYTDQIDYSKFKEIFYEPYLYNGDRYGVPLFYDVVILYYNKAMFDKAGVEYPDETWTWDDYFEAAKKLTIMDGKKVIQYGTLVDPWIQGGTDAFILQNGGKIFSDDRMKLELDSPESREAVQFLLDIIHKYGYAPKIPEMRELTKEVVFQSGMAATVTNHTGVLKQFAEVLGDDLGITVLPMQKKRATIYHSIGYLASAKTKYPEEVVELLSFFASKRHAEAVAKVWTPCYEGGSEIFFKEFDWLDTQCILDSLEYAYPLPIPAKNSGPGFNLLCAEMDKVFLNPEVGNSLIAVEQAVNREINK